MRRQILATTVVLGAVVTGISATGVFAALTDSARTGTNSVGSSALQGSADLRIAPATRNTSGGVTCGTFVDNLTTGLITATDQDVNGRTNNYVCLQNLGSASLNLSVAVENLQDVDFDCTGDESNYDESCGQNGSGELSARLLVSLTPHDCGTGAFSGDPTSGRLSDMTTAVSLGTIGSNERRCFNVTEQYNTASDSERQAAQSDRASWVFRFDAATVQILLPPPGGEQ